MAKLKVTSLSHVNQSLQGELIQQERREEEANLAMSDAPKSTVTYRLFKLSDTKKNGKYHMEGIDDVYNPAKDRMERIRLLRGFPSIWLEDQKGLEKTFIDSNRRSLVFDSRVLRVPSYDKSALEFLEHSNSNVGNPHKKGTKKLTFFEWNPLRVAEAERAKRVAKIEAIKFATMSSDDDMRKHCNFLGILFNDELGMPKSNEALRNDYELYAESQPNKFMKSAGSKEVEVAFVVKKAILSNKIDITSKKGSAYWAGNGGFICRIPGTVKPSVYLVEFAMLPQDDSKAFLEQLQKLV